RASLPASKTLERPNLPLRKQRFGFGDFELPAGDDLPHLEIARLALELAIFLVDFAAALWTPCGERREVSWNRVALIILRLSHDVLSHAHDLAHELRTLELPVLHLGELEFPLSGQLGREQFRNSQTV